MARFQKGVSGNPGGRPKKQITNLGAEARKFSHEALEILASIMRGEIRGSTVRDRLAAAMCLLDRGFGKPTQAIDIIMLGKKISELSNEELAELNARLVTNDVGEQPRVEETLN
jgi:hypothetical protein